MRNSILASLVLTALVGSGSVQAGTDVWPTRPIKLIVPAPQGGGTDLLARGLAEMMAPALGQPITIDNKAGGGGALGVTHLVAARPDGHTLALVWNGPLTATPHHLTVPYSTDHYVPIMSIAHSSYVFCGSAKLPITDAASFVSYLKNGSGKLTYGNDGSGGTMQLAAERIYQRIGVSVRGIPYSGAGDTARALVSGQIDFYGGSLPAILPHVRSGHAKCYLLTSTGRNASLPGVAGLDAIGLGNEETALWWVLIAPARTPTEVVRRIEPVAHAVVTSSAFSELLVKQGATTQYLAGDEIVDKLRREYAALSIVARSLSMARR